MADTSSISRVSSEEIPVATFSDWEHSKPPATKSHPPTPTGSGPVVRVETRTDTKPNITISLNLESQKTTNEQATSKWSANESGGEDAPQSSFTYNSIGSELKELSGESLTGFKNHSSADVDLDLKPQLIQILKAEKHSVKEEPSNDQWLQSLTQRLAAGGTPVKVRASRSFESNEFSRFVLQLIGDVVEKYYEHRPSAPDTEVLVRVLAQIHKHRTLPIVDAVIRQRHSKGTSSKTRSSSKLRQQLAADPTDAEPSQQFPSFTQTDSERHVKSERPRRSVSGRQRTSRRGVGAAPTKQIARRHQSTLSESGRGARRSRRESPREAVVADGVKQTRSLKERRPVARRRGSPRAPPVGSRAAEPRTKPSPSKTPPSKTHSEQSSEQASPERKVKTREQLVPPEARAEAPRRRHRTRPSKRRGRVVTRSGAAAQPQSVNVVSSESEQPTVYENAPEMEEYLSESYGSGAHDSEPQTTSVETPHSEESSVDNEGFGENEDRTQHDEPEAEEGASTDEEDDSDFIKPSGGFGAETIDPSVADGWKQAQLNQMMAQQLSPDTYKAQQDESHESGEDENPEQGESAAPDGEQTGAPASETPPVSQPKPTEEPQQPEPAPKEQSSEPKTTEQPTSDSGKQETAPKESKAAEDGAPKALEEQPTDDEKEDLIDPAKNYTIEVPEPVKEAPEPSTSSSSKSDGVAEAVELPPEEDQSPAPQTQPESKPAPERPQKESRPPKIVKVTSESVRKSEAGVRKERSPEPEERKASGEDAACLHIGAIGMKTEDQEQTGPEPDTSLSRRVHSPHPSSRPFTALLQDAGEKKPETASPKDKASPQEQKISAEPEGTKTQTEQKTSSETGIEKERRPSQLKIEYRENSIRFDVDTVDERTKATQMNDLKFVDTQSLLETMAADEHKSGPVTARSVQAGRSFLSLRSESDRKSVTQSESPNDRSSKRA